MSDRPVRCAVYTRKSSEEGLEQSFNSLEAQREACLAFILSQKHEGWVVLSNRYDDAGLSGGTMERPALKRLLDDILAGKVQSVVVYKVDRLTRSLNDFSKIIEVFDSHSVSFVSITQQFNTTTSMGRLTLNVLLSFAQFEREVTGERIRDKIAASKKKGMWMGGVVPQGYDCVDRRLVVNRSEALTVRRIFREYLRLGCVHSLKDYLDRTQIRSKTRVSVSGRKYGGAAYSRGALYHLLNNRIYIGEIVHRDQTHQGRHKAIVPRGLWNGVAARLQENNQAHRLADSQSRTSLLTGKLFDSNGARFTPTHSLKSAKRYRYYTSQTIIRRSGAKPQIARFPAQELEDIVTSRIRHLLQAPAQCAVGMKNTPTKGVVRDRASDLAKQWPTLEMSRKCEFVRSILRRVTVDQTMVWIEIDKLRLLATLLGKKPEAIRHCYCHEPDALKLAAKFHVLRAGGQTRVVPPHGDSTSERCNLSLVRAVARARDWYEGIVSGEIEAIGSLEKESGLTRTYITRIMQCAYLSPRIIEAIMSGNHPPNLSLKCVLGGVPLDWQEQKRKVLAFSSPPDDRVACTRR